MILSYKQLFKWYSIGEVKTALDFISDTLHIVVNQCPGIVLIIAEMNPKIAHLENTDYQKFAKQYANVKLKTHEKPRVTVDSAKSLYDITPEEKGFIIALQKTAQRSLPDHCEPQPDKVREFLMKAHNIAMRNPTYLRPSKEYFARSAVKTGEDDKVTPQISGPSNYMYVDQNQFSAAVHFMLLFSLI